MHGDLVKRLREAYSDTTECEHGFHLFEPYSCPNEDCLGRDLRHAADAIETLTARLAEAEEALRGNAAFIKAQAEERARIEAERDRLKAALERASRLPELDLAGQHAVTISDAIRAFKNKEQEND